MNMLLIQRLKKRSRGNYAYFEDAHILYLFEWLILAVMSMYTGAKTVIRTVYGNSNCFEVKLGMHQGSAFSPLLFVIVMEALSREFRVTLPWELLFGVVIAETEDDVIKVLMSGRITWRIEASE